MVGGVGGGGVDVLMGTGDEGFMFREKRWEKTHTPFKSAPRDVTAGADPAMGGVKKVRPPPLWLSSIVSDGASYAAGDQPTVMSQRREAAFQCSCRRV